MKISRILLVHSAHYDDCGSVVRADKFIDRLSVANVVHMALPLLAAYLPSDIEMELVEDCFEEVNFDDEAQVVAISAQVMQVERARDIATEFRKRGKIVVIGGYLPTMHPEMIEDVVDSMCLGEGDKVWKQMISDIENGCLKKVYKGEASFDISEMPTPRYDLIKKDRFVVYPVQATRGCPFTCEYCSIIQFNQYTYRHRPVEHIIRDIKATKSKFIFFTDDNLMEDTNFAKKLFREMIPLKVTWGSQVTINCHKDPELLDLAYKAGCRWLAVGMESLSQDNLNGVGKGFNKAGLFKGQIENIHLSGIAVHALIMFGLDQDTPEVFKQTIDYLDNINISVAEFFTATPYPKTPMGKQAWDAGKITDSNLAHFREGYIVFDHPQMSSDEILKYYWATLREFYSLKNILKRHLFGKFKNKFYHLGKTLVYWIKIKRNIIPVYFGRGNTPVA
ncbi:MAG: B12-binding domain-containing radical SAM protein [Bacteriovoracaceae bacterium]|jgi:radical SAM superfamily enzyme YgiQ (UPF0313 family)|nr:B12-binding domain-containing radical SAM protein [Bacteriovoracaceae bacterium]